MKLNLQYTYIMSAIFTITLLTAAIVPPVLATGQLKTPPTGNCYSSKADGPDAKMACKVTKQPNTYTQCTKYHSGQWEPVSPIEFDDAMRAKNVCFVPLEAQAGIVKKILGRLGNAIGEALFSGNR